MTHLGGLSHSLEPHYQFQRDLQANQAVAGSDTEERTEPAQRWPSNIIGGGGYTASKVQAIWVPGYMSSPALPSSELVVNTHHFQEIWFLPLPFHE